MAPDLSEHGKQWTVSLLCGNAPISDYSIMLIFSSSVTDESLKGSYVPAKKLRQFENMQEHEFVRR